MAGHGPDHAGYPREIIVLFTTEGDELIIHAHALERRLQEVARSMNTRNYGHTKSGNSSPSMRPFRRYPAAGSARENRHGRARQQPALGECRRPIYAQALWVVEAMTRWVAMSSVEVVNQRLDHADVAVTMRVQQHVTQQDDQAAADGLRAPSDIV